MKRDCSYKDVLEKAVSLFFEAYEPKLDSLSLADSNGMPIHTDKWTLGNFYQSNGLQPSRYKLYVVIQVNLHLIPRGCGDMCTCTKY